MYNPLVHFQNFFSITVKLYFIIESYTLLFKMHFMSRISFLLCIFYIKVNFLRLLFYFYNRILYCYRYQRIWNTFYNMFNISRKRSFFNTLLLFFRLVLHVTCKRIFVLFNKLWTILFRWHLSEAIILILTIHSFTSGYKIISFESVFYLS